MEVSVLISVRNDTYREAAFLRINNCQTRAVNGNGALFYGNIRLRMLKSEAPRAILIKYFSACAYAIDVALYHVAV